VSGIPNETIKKLINATEVMEEHFPVLVEYYDCIWEFVDYEVVWNIEDIEDELSAREGETYSGEVHRGQYEIGDDYCIFNLNNGCGDIITTIFSTKKRINHA